MIYLVLYGVLLFGGTISSSQGQFRRILFFVFSGLLFAFVAFRYEVGCDWDRYAEHFVQTRFWDSTEAMLSREPAYWLLHVQLHSLGLDYPYLNLFMAVPFFWGLLALARREPDPLGFLILSFPVLIINMPMSGIRQSAAIGFVCLALIAFQNHRLIRFVALIVAGALFHASAVLFLALAPFVKFRITLATLVLSAILVLPSAYFMLVDTVDLYVDRYVGTGIEAGGAPFRVGLLAIVGGYFLLALRRAYQTKFPASYTMVLIGAWLMLGALAVAPISSVISDRFGYYLTPLQLMIMARLPYLVRGRPLLVAAPYLALGLVLLVWTQYSEHFTKCYLPYQTWLGVFLQ